MSYDDLMPILEYLTDCTIGPDKALFLKPNMLFFFFVFFSYFLGKHVVGTIGAPQ